MGLLDIFNLQNDPTQSQGAPDPRLMGLLGAIQGYGNSTAYSRMPISQGQKMAQIIGGFTGGLGQGYQQNLVAQEGQKNALANQYAQARMGVLKSIMPGVFGGGQSSDTPTPNGTPGFAPPPSSPPSSPPMGLLNDPGAAGGPPQDSSYSPVFTKPPSQAAPAQASSAAAPLPDAMPGQTAPQTPLAQPSPSAQPGLTGQIVKQALLADFITPGAGKEIMAKQFPGPTDAQRALVAAGIDPNSVQGRSLLSSAVSKAAGDPSYLATTEAAKKAATFSYDAASSYLRYAGRPVTVGNAVIPGYEFLPPKLRALVEGGDSPAAAPTGKTSSFPPPPAPNAAPKMVGSGAPPYSGLTALPGGGFVNNQRDTRLASLDSDLLKQMNETAEKSHQSQMTTREGLGLLNNFQTGKLGSSKLQLMGWAKALGFDPHSIPGVDSKDNTAAGEALNKVFLQTTANAVRVMGAREPGSVISMFKAAYPSLDVRPETAKLMLNLIDQQYQRDIDRVQTAGKFLKNNPSGYISTDFDAYFNDKHPVEEYIGRAYKNAGLTEGDVNKIATSESAAPSAPQIDPGAARQELIRRGVIKP